MVNAYHKILNGKTAQKFNVNVISDIQKSLTESAKFLNNNLQNLTQDVQLGHLNKDDIDINTLLKYYLLNQLINHNSGEKFSEKDLLDQNEFVDTANPMIKLDKATNKFYMNNGNDLQLAEEIQTVNDNGSYIITEQINHSTYVIKKLFDINNNLKSFQLIDSNNSAVKNKWEVVQILGMKKEFVQKYKYAGFSGNSNDIVASLLNRFAAPVETGCYMDKQCNLYKWHHSTSSFVIYRNLATRSPLLTDYEFEKNDIVIRKEYKGIK